MATPLSIVVGARSGGGCAGSQQWTDKEVVPIRRQVFAVHVHEPASTVIANVARAVLSIEYSHDPGRYELLPVVGSVEGKRVGYDDRIVSKSLAEDIDDRPSTPASVSCKSRDRKCRQQHSNDREQKRYFFSCCLHLNFWHVARLSEGTVTNEKQQPNNRVWSDNELPRPRNLLRILSFGISPI